jgi:hypothetical protein
MQNFQKAVQLGLALIGISMPLVASATDHQQETKVVINGHELTAAQIDMIRTVYRYVPPPGKYWYDSRSGAWGLEGHETAGFILPGLDFGPLPANASHGDTGVFINGREINKVEAVRIYLAFGGLYRGHWWLDGRTGYYGLDGNPMPLGNVAALMKSQHSGQGQDNFWCGRISCGNFSGSGDKSGDYYSVDGHVLNTPY